LFEHTHILGSLLKFRGEDEFIQALILTKNDLFIAAFPFFFALVHENDMIAEFPLHCSYRAYSHLL
jgi:hypothetical protein